MAASMDLEGVAQELVKGGCELCLPNNNGLYPIHLAAKTASQKALEVILTGAQARGVSRETMFSYLAAENNTALHSAVNGGHLAAVSACLLNGARVDARFHAGSQKQIIITC